MKISNFAAYIAQLWRNKPDTSTPLSAERLRHIEDGIKGNSDAIEAIAAAVVNQIVNDPDKIASMAALYAVNQKVSALDGKVGDTAQLPDGATDVVTAITQQNSDLKNMWSLSGNQTLVPNNSDMHTYLTPGNYYCASNTNAETLKNSPLKFAFTMKVYLSVGIGSQYLIQEYTKYDASERILVYYDGNRNIWTSYHVQLEKMV